MWRANSSSQHGLGMRNNQGALALPSVILYPTIDVWDPHVTVFFNLMPLPSSSRLCRSTREQRRCSLAQTSVPFRKFNPQVGVAPGAGRRRSGGCVGRCRGGRAPNILSSLSVCLRNNSQATGTSTYPKKVAASQVCTNPASKHCFCFAIVTDQNLLDISCSLAGMHESGQQLL